MRISCVKVILALFTFFIVIIFLGNNEESGKESTSNIGPTQFALLYDQSFTANEYITKIDINNLACMINRAEKIESRPFNKGSYKMIINDVKVHFSYYGHFFWIDGVTGYYYRIEEADKNEYDLFFNALLGNTIIPWRLGEQSN